MQADLEALLKIEHLTGNLIVYNRNGEVFLVSLEVRRRMIVRIFFVVCLVIFSEWVFRTMILGRNRMDMI